MAEGRPPFKRAVAVIPRLSAPTLSGARRAKMTDPKQLPFESFGPGHSISTRIGSLPWPTMRNIRLPIPICPITSDLEQLTQRGEPFASLPFHASRSPVPSFVPTYLWVLPSSRTAMTVDSSAALFNVIRTACITPSRPPNPRVRSEAPIAGPVVNRDTPSDETTALPTVRCASLTRAQDGYAPIPRPAYAPVVRETPPHSSARARTMRVLVVTNTHSSRWLYNLAV